MRKGALYILYKRISSALFSGNKAAYLGILVKLLRPITLMFDGLQSRSITEAEISEFKIPPCIMLISPSRSGSTIIYQVLTRVIPCVYISNYHNLFPKTASSKMHRDNLFGISGDNLKNYYGYTSSVFDVSEGNEILENILAGGSDKAEIRKRFTAFLIRMGASSEKPLIFKNVQSYHHLALLHAAVPELKFLRITRNTEQVAQSMLRAYHELGYFYSTPEELKAYNTEDPVEFTILHLLGIEKSIEKQLNQISQDNIIRCSYEDFCDAPEKLISALTTLLFESNSGSIELNPLNIQLSASHRIKVSPEEAEKISALIDKLNSI